MPLSGADKSNSRQQHPQDTNGHGPSSSFKCRDAPLHANRHLRVICIGAGASGLYLAYKLKYYFTDFTLNIYEKNPEVGGTWFENRYPGCVCDVPAHVYTYTFEPKWDWSSLFAPAPEILKYFCDFVNKYKLREYISCNHEIIGARWDGTTSDRCDFLINAGGYLNKWRWPSILGVENFKGPKLHSAAWDGSIDLKGKHIGLIGNGSSGIQLLQKLQSEVYHLTTFIRNPFWICSLKLPQFYIYKDEEKQSFRDDPTMWLQMRRATERALAGVFPLFVKNSATQKAASAYMKDQMIQKLGDKELSDRLIPNFGLGCRRITPGIGYMESLSEPNVSVVFGNVTEITADACVTDDGRNWPIDILICATGFDTTFQPQFPLIGRDGKSLADEWTEEPRSYLGMAVHGYPNYFMFLGPNSPNGNGPLMCAIEAQGQYMAHFMNRWQKEDLASIEPKVAAVNDFMEQKDAFMKTSVWGNNCSSWYRNHKTGKVTALWPGSTPHYLEATVAPRYEDFDIGYRTNRFAYLGNGFSQAELNPNVDSADYIRNEDCGELLCRSLESTFNAKNADRLMNEICESII
ncbi:NAD(P)-binding rossmann-like domain-containing protein [Hirsutella rhossiliensis]|uniref:NAD(P)-binding rossmann-like domain-containing protein n=1 Tax=Hirsutella rhossiliensis TaxID=111463 RepID=A0A9P8SP27_9HYPO|nr:NAD(P)-binding rossmann-like domain-containing protein [Hirsutella rhossiliensis]KAH0967761.1 NAD(P)-binding rossmann-like domain-containing protein [Hirsutella rhossiliensis]